MLKYLLLLLILVGCGFPTAPLESESQCEEREIPIVIYEQEVPVDTIYTMVTICVEFVTISYLLPMQVKPMEHTINIMLPTIYIGS